MNATLAVIYPWVKALHIISVMAWMAGLFYLPRLFVYHAGAVTNDSDQLFAIMELRLLRVIMNPAMITAWIFGILLAITPGVVDWSAIWPWTKAAGVLAMTWFHHWLSLRRKDFAVGMNKFTERQFRFMNEIPTVLLILIVVSVIVRPF